MKKMFNLDWKQVGTVGISTPRSQKPDTKAFADNFLRLLWAYSKDPYIDET